MNAAQHYAEAERLVRYSDGCDNDGYAAVVVAQAQVHATLALADMVQKLLSELQAREP